MKKILATLALTTAMGAVAAPVLAQSQGDWTVGVGLGWADPKSNNATVGTSTLQVSDDLRPTLTVEYFIRDNIGIELLAATPFEHDIALGGTNVGSTKHLPPTLSLNYHIPTTGSIKPFVGFGINYTTFWDETVTGGTLSLDDSWGFAAHAGIDYEISANGWLRMDLRWIDINTEASINGGTPFDVEIDPIVVGVSYVHRF